MDIFNMINIHIYILIWYNRKMMRYTWSSSQYFLVMSPLFGSCWLLTSASWLVFQYTSSRFNPLFMMERLFFFWILGLKIIADFFVFNVFSCIFWFIHIPHRQNCCACRFSIASKAASRFCCWLWLSEAEPAPPKRWPVGPVPKSRARRGPTMVALRVWPGPKQEAVDLFHVMSRFRYPTIKSWMQQIPQFVWKKEQDTRFQPLLLGFQWWKSCKTVTFGTPFRTMV